MPRSISRNRTSRSGLHGHRRALDLLEARLERVDPNFEQARIDRAMLRVFGPEPHAWYVPPEHEGK